MFSIIDIVLGSKVGKTIVKEIPGLTLGIPHLKNQERIEEARKNFRKARRIANEGKDEITKSSTLFLESAEAFEQSISKINEKRHSIYFTIILPLHKKIGKARLILPEITPFHKVSIPSVPDVDVFKDALKSSDMLTLFGLSGSIFSQWKSEEALEDSLDALNLANSYKNKALIKSAEINKAKTELDSYAAVSKIYQKALNDWIEIWDSSILNNTSTSDLMTIFKIISSLVKRFPMPGDGGDVEYKLSAVDVFRSIGR